MHDNKVLGVVCVSCQCEHLTPSNFFYMGLCFMSVSRSFNTNPCYLKINNVSLLYNYISFEKLIHSWGNGNVFIHGEVRYRLVYPRLFS